MRDAIISEIQRIAKEAGGKAPGHRLFERETGMGTSVWRGLFWARWSDALREAGLTPNEKQGRFDRQLLFEKLVNVFRYYGREPTISELEMYRGVDPNFPWYSTINNNFSGKQNAMKAFGEWLIDKPDFSDVAEMLPLSDSNTVESFSEEKSSEGHVYLIKSGDFYKIGRSDQLERRIKEIRIALPDVATLVHSIRTDDSPGIEAYWHRRFAAQRANGEWFRLSSTDVAAFRRRKFQ